MSESQDKKENGKTKVLFKKDSDNKAGKEKAPGTPKKTGGNKQGFNPYWIYAIIAVPFLLFYLFPQDGAKKISSTELMEKISKKEISKIIVVNRSGAEVYLSKEAKKSAEGKKGQKSKSIFSNPEGPDYLLEDIGDYQTFYQQIEKSQEGYTQKERIGIENVKRADYLDSIINWIFLILLFVGFWFIVLRRMGGGGGGGGAGQIFSIGKSKAQLFDKDTKVNMKQEMLSFVHFRL